MRSGIELQLSVSFLRVTGAWEPYSAAMLELDNADRHEVGPLGQQPDGFC